MFIGIVAASDGRWIVKTGGQLIAELAMLLTSVLLTRLYGSTNSPAVNILIHCVHVLSKFCLLVFAKGWASRRGREILEYGGVVHHAASIQHSKIIEVLAGRARIGGPLNRTSAFT